MKSDKNKASPIRTWLGGICCVPSAFLRKESTIIILVKEVIIMIMAGARDKTVKISSSWMLDETSCGVVAGSTLKPNLKGNVVSA